VRLNRRTRRSAGDGSVMGARLPGVGEEGWSAGGSGALWQVGEDGESSECWTTMGKSMSITGKLSCSGCEDCV